ncbi:MAG: hypothetical protein ACR652_24640 [Methylocystis sp.]|uniref:hypothetical protein n=1 Tax=Methylocystis sp. TaxID=1911079 RepID=UPI003DA5BC77
MSDWYRDEMRWQEDFEQRRFDFSDSPWSDSDEQFDQWMATETLPFEDCVMCGIVGHLRISVAVTSDMSVIEICGACGGERVVPRIRQGMFTDTAVAPEFVEQPARSFYYRNRVKAHRIQWDDRPPEDRWKDAVVTNWINGVAVIDSATVTGSAMAAMVKLAAKAVA